MKLKPKTTIAEHFAIVEDPRIERSKWHLLIDILTLEPGKDDQSWHQKQALTSWMG